MYNTILFDLDGTLTDPKEGITKSVQHALKAFGVEAELDDLLCFIGPPLQWSFEEYYGFDEEKAKLAIEKYRERFREVGMFENEVYEGIEEMLKTLAKEGKTLAVATSKPEVFAVQILEHFGLAKYFKVIVGSELDGTRVNKKDVIEEVFVRLQLTEEEKVHILMIGDRKHDIIGAKACGIDSIGVRFGYGEGNELEEAGATYIVETVGELGKNIVSIR
ncbi:MAG: HAD family hydrolase [Cellulosilyticaceae bacterium]